MVFESLSLSQFISLIVLPPDKPSIWSELPDTPTVHRSEFDVLILGDIALGGGDLTSVSVLPVGVYCTITCRLCNYGVSVNY